jgi:hypothetical protein
MKRNVAAERPPRASAAKATWLQQIHHARAMKGSVRLNNGGFRGFVSAEGLIVTNHHVGATTLIQKSVHQIATYSAKVSWHGDERRGIEVP